MLDSTEVSPLQWILTHHFRYDVYDLNGVYLFELFEILLDLSMIKSNAVLLLIEVVPSGREIHHPL